MATPALGARPRLTRRAGAAVRPQQSRVNPFNVHRFKHGKVAEVPDPIEFVISDKFLDRPNLYPRQATILKVMFLRRDMLTQYDYDVIGEWEEAFTSTGNKGISPKVLDRMDIISTCPCKHSVEHHRNRMGACTVTDCTCGRYDGRSWFRETQAVIGRRGGKGYLGGLGGSYVTWNYMHRPGGPQDYYGIDRDKRLTGIVFAGKKEQARDNLWRDWTNVILGGPCFGPYISRPQAERLTIYAPSDVLKAERLAAQGIVSENDIASFEIIPAPSTVMAARGPAMFTEMFDEQAHVISSTAAADAEAVYDAATPALDQFKKDGFIYAPSSPWRKTGKFFENWELAIEMEPDGTPSYPERLMVQLESWGPYEDWDEADRIPVRPPKKTVIEMDVEVKRRRRVNGKTKTVVVTETQQVERLVPAPTFKALKSAVQTYDDQMRSLQRANPDTFAVERLSHWAESLDAYLNPKKVEAMFGPWQGSPLTVSTRASLNQTYVAHGDPANTNKRFGWSLAHRVWVPDESHAEGGMFHVVFDKINCWDPADFEDHVLDYDIVMDDIETDVRTFLPEDVSFDQFNVPATIGRLRKFVRASEFPKNIVVREVSRTRNLNWRHAELFKAALNMGLVHAPMFLDQPDESGEGLKVNYASSEAELELKFLEEKNGSVDHPTTGPVQTKDIADTIMEVTVTLIGRQMATFLGQEFTEVGISGSADRGTDPYRNTTAADRLGEVTGSAVRRGVGSPGAARSRGGGMRRR